MTARTKGFAVADEDRPRLDRLVQHFGHGNSSEFLRVAMDRMEAEMRAEQMRAIAEEVERSADPALLGDDEALQAAIKAAYKRREPPQ
jgi:hypothetical protein